MENITGAQIRAARALLRITAEDLATLARLGVATVRRAELEEGPSKMTPANSDALRGAIRAAGVVLFDADKEGGVGARLQAN